MLFASLLLQGAVALPSAAGAPAEAPARITSENLAVPILPELQEEGAEEETGPWSFAVDAGAIVESGNTNAISGNANASAIWEVTQQKWISTGQYRAKREEDQTTGENFSDRRLLVIDSQYNYYFSEAKNLYGYGKGAYRTDRPNGLDVRTDIGAGAGYKFDLYGEKAYAAIEAGVSYVDDQKIDMMGGTPDSLSVSTAALRLAYDINTPLTPTMDFVNQGESLNGDDLETYIHTTTYRWALRDNLYLAASFQIIFDGNPAPGDTSTDRIFTVSMGLSF